MRRLAWVFVPACLFACSRGFDSEALGMSWEPPSGISVVDQDDHRVLFRDGVAWYRLTDKDLHLDEARLSDQLIAAATEANAPLEGTIGSARLGTLPVGPVARFDVRGNGKRGLAYLIPHQRGAVLMVAVMPEARFGMVSAAVERSLSTLKLR